MTDTAPMQPEGPSQLITVKCAARELHYQGHVIRCAIGKNGAVPGAQGREGDGRTPLGTYHMRFGFYRADRIEKPDTALTLRALCEDDGWCDDSSDPAYNRFVRLPYPASHERMWRDDAAYDICLVLSHNDSPPIPGLGSAIFLHLERENYRPTLGCVAISKTDMLDLLTVMRPGAIIALAR